ncbi:hypothetical protein [Clostridium tarantellae]|nr:hypothetical protein [Clostridium tarantellae]
MKAKASLFIIIAFIIFIIGSYFLVTTINSGKIHYPTQNEILQSHGLRH